LKNNIYIDSRFFKENPDGVSRYITEICKILQNEYNLIFCSNKAINLPDELKNINNKILEYGLFKYLPGSIFITTILPFILFFKKGIFWGGGHAIPLFGMKSILTIHDLVAFEHPSTMTAQGLILNKFSVYVSLLFAHRLTTVSIFTKKRLVILFPKLVNNRKIIVVPNSVDQNVFFKEKEKKTDVNKIINNSGVTNYLLSIGTIEPRKNLLELITSFKKLMDSNKYKGKLLIVGASGWKNKEIYKYINDNNLQDDIILTGFLSDESINSLMNNCDLFVFPSKYEGFGIPPLEAYCAGAKILSTTYSEIPNLGLKDIIYFDPKKDNLSEKILIALNSEHNSMNYTLSWQQSGEALIKIIKDISCE